VWDNPTYNRKEYMIESNKKFKIKYTKNDGEEVRRFGILTDNCRGFGKRAKDNRPFLHYYDLDKKGYRYATNWEIL
jgi:dihydropteroate synthase